MSVSTVLFLLEVALLLVAVAGVLAWRVITNRTAVRHQVIVNKLDGTALRGVLWARRGRLLILRQAVLLERGADPVDLDGEVLIDRGVVDFVQSTGRGA